MSFMHPQQRRTRNNLGKNHEKKKQIHGEPRYTFHLTFQFFIQRRVNLPHSYHTDQPPYQTERRIYVFPDMKRSSRVIPKSHLQKVFSKISAKKFESCPQKGTFQKNISQMIPVVFHCHQIDKHSSTPHTQPMGKNRLLVLLLNSRKSIQHHSVSIRNPAVPHTTYIQNSLYTTAITSSFVKGFPLAFTILFIVFFLFLFSVSSVSLYFNKRIVHPIYFKNICFWF